jgi:hypothetical protein
MLSSRRPVYSSTILTKIGERVRMRSGPLKGLEGRLERTNDQFRLVVSVELLCRSIATEVDAEAMEMLTSERNSLRRAVTSGLEFIKNPVYYRVALSIPG